jgi:hypothetical protein
MVVVVAIGVAVACDRSPVAPALPLLPMGSAAPPVSIAVDGQPPAAGSSAQFRATGLFEDGSVVDLTAAAQWSSARMSVATVSAGGIVTGVAGGAGEVRADFRGRFGTRKILVSGPGSYFAFISDDGDPVGMGMLGSAPVTARETHPLNDSNPEALRILRGAFGNDLFPEGQIWELRFAMPAGQTLRPGLFEPVALWPLQPPDAFGLRVGIDRRFCERVSGRLVIHEYAYGPFALSRFHATFEQFCDGRTAGLRGEVTWNH